MARRFDKTNCRMGGVICLNRLRVNRLVTAQFVHQAFENVRDIGILKEVGGGLKDDVGHWCNFASVQDFDLYDWMKLDPVRSDATLPMQEVEEPDAGDSQMG